LVTQEKVKSLFVYDPAGFLLKRSSGEISEVPHSGGYYQVSIEGVAYLAHRLIFLYHYGYLPKLVDHINRNKKDNRIQNLRELSVSANGINTDKVNSNTGVKGVTYCKRDKRFRANICKDRKNYSLGYFKSLEEAEIAYKNKRMELFPDVFTEQGTTT